MPWFLPLHGSNVFRNNCIRCAAASDLSLVTNVPHGQTGGGDRGDGDGIPDSGEALANLCGKALTLLASLEHCPHLTVILHGD